MRRSRAGSVERNGPVGPGGDIRRAVDVRLGSTIFRRTVAAVVGNTHRAGFHGADGQAALGVGGVGDTALRHLPVRMNPGLAVKTQGQSLRWGSLAIVTNDGSPVTKIAVQLDHDRLGRIARAVLPVVRLVDHVAVFVLQDQGEIVGSLPLWLVPTKDQDHHIRR